MRTGSCTTVLISVSGQSGLFTEPIVRFWAFHVTGVVAQVAVHSASRWVEVERETPMGVVDAP
jgi:hypothetical protein